MELLSVFFPQSLHDFGQANSYGASFALFHLQSNPDIVPFFVQPSLRQCIKGSGKFKYCITENFCLQTFMGPN